MKDSTLFSLWLLAVFRQLHVEWHWICSFYSRLYLWQL